MLLYELGYRGKRLNKFNHTSRVHILVYVCTNVRSVGVRGTYTVHRSNLAPE